MIGWWHVAFVSLVPVFSYLLRVMVRAEKALRVEVKNRCGELALALAAMPDGIERVE